MICIWFIVRVGVFYDKILMIVNNNLYMCIMLLFFLLNLYVCFLYFRCFYYWYLFNSYVVLLLGYVIYDVDYVKVDFVLFRNGFCE